MAATAAAETAASVLERIRRHADILITEGTDRYGSEHTPLFMATLDPATHAYPSDDRRPSTFVQRAYRFIHAPRGCAAYWDQPTLATLVRLSQLSGDDRYRRAVDAYLDFFMTRCVATNSIFLWGNHYYWDAFQDCNVGFKSDNDLHPISVDEPATLHEMRPIFPCWEELYRVNATAVEREIRVSAEWHLFDPAGGGFNRHTDRKAGCAFLESGGILVHALCFLYGKTRDATLLDTALRVARYSFGNRNHATDLVVNDPTQTRWDSRMVTTEVGLWARALLLAAGLVEGTPRSGDTAVPGAAAATALREMAQRALGAYLRYGFDPAARRYYGRLNLDGTPNLEPRETPYMPAEHSSAWEFLFPTHDYPMAMAMATLECAGLSGAPGASAAGSAERSSFMDGARRLAEIARMEAEVWPEGQVRYAEHYGRLIVYLAEYGHATGEAVYRLTAERLAQQAVERLDTGSLFLGRTNANWYDAIDGLGFLFLALLHLEAPDPAALALF